MRRSGTATFVLTVCALLSSPRLIRAQATTDDKPRPESHIEKITPLKIQVVQTEFDGDKKVKSMPYVSYLNVYEAGRGGSTKLRIGTRVPVHTGKEAGLQYIDVGTNIDCRATLGSAGNYNLELVVERSWVESGVTTPKIKPSAEEKEKSEFLMYEEPIIRQFKTEMGVSLRDGQTSESTLATDPISGRVSKIEVSLSVLK